MNVRQLFFAAFLFALHQVQSSAIKHFKIVGGEEVSTLDFPYVIRLEKCGNHMCGGSVINENYVLTAAHCVSYYKYLSPVPLYVLKIRVGSDETLTGGQVYGIEKIITHENYEDERTIDQYDIALLRTSDSIRFNERVKPIKLASKSPEEGLLAWVVGYGKEEVRRSSRVHHLKAIQIPIVSLIHCRSKLDLVAEDMICAGKPTGHEDSCMGDSGGPLTVNGELAGIVAWGRGCGREGLPGVYTNVAKYKEWVYKNMKISDEGEDDNE